MGAMIELTPFQIRRLAEVTVGHRGDIPHGITVDTLGVITIGVYNLTHVIDRLGRCLTYGRRSDTPISIRGRYMGTNFYKISVS